jgi:hypothetical protein
MFQRNWFGEDFEGLELVLFFVKLRSGFKKILKVFKNIAKEENRVTKIYHEFLRIELLRINTIF